MNTILYESYYGVASFGEPYLEHHGIKGQKWGVRRYQNPDGTLTEAGRRRYGTVENYRQYRRTKKGALQRQGTRVVGEFRKQQGTLKGIIKEKGLGNKVSSTVGYKRLERDRRIDASTQTKLAKQSRTLLGQRYHEAKAYNNEQLSKYAKDMQSKSTGEKLVESMVFRKNLMNVSVKRLSGRQTTFGANLADKIFTGGTAGLLMDAVYLHKQHKESKKANNSK